jgi:hypothetical protein
MGMREKSYEDEIKLELLSELWREMRGIFEKHKPDEEDRGVWHLFKMGHTTAMMEAMTRISWRQEQIVMRYVKGDGR